MPALSSSPPTLESRARSAVSWATQYAFDLAKDDGHWNGELLSNVTITSEQVFFYQSLYGGRANIPDSDEYRRYILGEQRADGSWSIAPQCTGDISTSCEAYLALKILGVSPECLEMQRARRFILRCGGVAKVRVFTRIFFAQFGLFPWDATPQLPAEFILAPAVAPLNVYRLSSWARSTVIPILIIAHHRPIYALPNGISKNNTFLDEIWMSPSNKNVPLGPSLLGLLGSDLFTAIFSIVDRGLYWLGGLRRNPLRSYARRQCVKWNLDHQETSGDWAGIIPPMHAGVQALLLEGYTLASDPVRRAIEAIERFTWQDDKGKRLQSCVSPVWDTVLMIRALCDAGVKEDSPELRKAIVWTKQRQLLGREGDWRVYCAPHIPPGGFSFEYHNSWYPDVDDTAAAILAMVRHSPSAIESASVVHAARWICGMQNKDGGWAAFDLDNDKLWLNKIPFSDMDALCDPSTADVTGRIIEAFGLIIHTALVQHQYISAGLLNEITSASERALSYLAHNQETNGSWYGRWGSNYIYGTSNVICGLMYFVETNDHVKVMMDSGVSWLKTVQNQDGGWGECLQSYRNPAKAGCGPSTPSQTAWALMALLTLCHPSDSAVVKGVSHLANTQTDVQGRGKSWPEALYTGTGFPNFFYIGYTLYRHYFPIMALGRFLEACSKNTNRQPAVEKKLQTNGINGIHVAT